MRNSHPRGAASERIELTGDGLYKYTYDAWNRLAGVWYHDCAVDGNGVPSDANERVARYRYDGLFRRVSKQVTNQGTGVVFRSDDLDRNGTPDATGILAGDRHEHYFYAGWRLVETTNHVTGGGGYSYGDSAVLNQFVYGTQYIDEPVRYDRNTDASSDDDCLDAGGSRAYFYHQDANWRTVALTGEDGQIVERVEYTAYGEPTLFGGPAPGGGDDDSGAGDELGNAMLVSTVGNPLLHQGLFPLTRRERAKPAARDASRPALRAAACPGFRDRETLTYHNRFRQYDPRSGRFMQRDPLYADLIEAYEYNLSCPWSYVDPIGLQTSQPTSKPTYPVDPVVLDVLNRARQKQDQRRKAGRPPREDGGLIKVNQAGNTTVTVSPGMDATSWAPFEGIDVVHPGERLSGSWHTHPGNDPPSFNDESGRGGDVGALVGGEVGSVMIVQTSDGCVYVMVVTNPTEAKKCKDNPKDEIEKVGNDAYNKCLADAIADGSWKVPTNGEGKKTIPVDDQGNPKPPECIANKCAGAGLGAVAGNCGMDVFRGCGGRTPTPMK